MGSHLIDGEFQSDKYPMCPRGKVPLSCKDKTAQDLLWQYAQRRRVVDAEFADDLETALKLAGYAPAPPQWQPDEAMVERVKAGIRGADAEFVNGNLTYDQMLDAMARAAIAALSDPEAKI